MRHVRRNSAETQVDIEEGFAVSGKPTGLECEGAAGRGPFRAVGGGGHAAAWECQCCVWGGRKTEDIHGYDHCMPYGQ